ncbi:LuxR C-terminal-related transcriptional regulator [Kitasatospora sp. A2-31]|uniref:LuxR C-terminal-related transcriptional regulator n=1 Tax=Kitasatospora sp. A2-31 TaxID=2916414 RepID=UPI001EEB25E5|nr:LuxR C-terminal-related transcriptional regulator [Kitasatospora sp. A2-31]MCG6496491.1 LuxR C-terminal-related transcriptional regulator [Kitasatospora sp. A2-31]
MSTPPTAERPTGAPTDHQPAPQGRPGKGRPGRGRAAAKPAQGTPLAPQAQAAPGGQTAGGARGRAAGGTSPDPAEASRLLRQLTPREAQALAHLAAGRPLAESAAALGVTPATARTYQHRAMRKLGTRTRAEIGAFAALLSPAQASPAAGETAGAAGRPEPAPPERGTAAEPSASSAGPDRGRPGGSGADREKAGTVKAGGEKAGGEKAGGEKAGGVKAGGARVGAPEGGASPDRPAPGGPAAPAAPGGRHRRKGPSDGARPGPPDGTAPETAGPGGGRHRRGGPAGRPRPADRAADRAAERPGNPAPAGPGAPVAAADRDGGRERPAAPAQAAAAPRSEPPGTATDPTPEAGRAQAGRAQAGRAQAGSAQAGRAEAGAGEPKDSRRRQRPGRPDSPDHSVAASPRATARTGPRSEPKDSRRQRPRRDRPHTPAPAPAFEELYGTAHARLVQQTFLLTACKHRALHCVGRAFAEAQRHWVEVSGEPDPEGWLRTRAFEAALSPWHRGGPRRAHVWRLPHRRIKVRPADETQAVLPDHDRLTDHDRALLKALRRLSRPQRRALVLHDGLGLPADAVAVEVESTVAAAEGRVWAARAALALWVPELVGPDPAADGFADRLSGLLHRAAVRGCPEPHRPPVPLLRARHGLADAGRTGAAALLTAAVGAAVVATLSGGGPGQLFRPGEPPAPTLCATAGTVAAVPAPPDAPPTGVHSLWCSPTPGVEAVVVDPPPPRRLWELPSAGRTAEALPPPGTVTAGPPACTVWTLRPCPTDDVGHPAPAPAEPR